MAIHTSEADFHKATIEAVADLYDNMDSILAEDCMKAMAEDRPAYWPRDRHGNQLAGWLASAGTQGNIVLTGEARAAAKRHTEARMKAMGLNRLVPLNDAAEIELSTVYDAFGDFIYPHELAVRRVKKGAL